MSNRVLFFTLSSIQSLALSLVNLVTCLISIIFECFQYIFQVFSMRASRECDQVYCFIVSGCFQWARMRAGYANRKRCIIVDAEYRHRPSEVPRRSARNIFILYIFSFFSRFRFARLYPGEKERGPVVFHRIHGADYCMKYDLGIHAAVLYWIWWRVLIKERTHMCIPIAGYNIYRYRNKR